MLGNIFQFKNSTNNKLHNNRLTRVFNSVTISLLMATLLVVCLCLIRFGYTQKITFFFLLWNLFLAWIPYFCAIFWKNFRHKSGRNLWMQNLPLVFCILFLPNAPYIITDLIHLKNTMGSYKLLDEALVFTCAWNGLMLFMATLHIINKELKNYVSPIWNQLIILVIIFISGFGIYVGRYLRFNSWDILSSPFKLINATADVIFNPFENMRAWAVTLFFATLLWISFLFLKSYVGKEETE